MKNLGERSEGFPNFVKGGVYPLNTRITKSIEKRILLVRLCSVIMRLLTAFVIACTFVYIMLYCKGTLRYLDSLSAIPII